MPNHSFTEQTYIAEIPPLPIAAAMGLELRI
jgi:hypothetical protein